jgi:hypothetical protein
VTTTDKPAGADPGAAQVTWRLDTDNGSMVPRSALDVLVDLNDNLASGRFGEYQPVPLGLDCWTRPSAAGCGPESFC